MVVPAWAKNPPKTKMANKRAAQDASSASSFSGPPSKKPKKEEDKKTEKKEEDIMSPEERLQLEQARKILGLNNLGEEVAKVRKQIFHKNTLSI